VDVAAREVRLAGNTIALTAVEFDLLLTLLRAAGEVVMRETLARSVLGRPLLPYDRSIDVHISSVRKKLGPHAGGAERIKTVRSSGYSYAPAPEVEGGGDAGESAEIARP
jgi:two-component system response regulator CpxR